MPQHFSELVSPPFRVVNYDSVLEISDSRNYTIVTCYRKEAAQELCEYLNARYYKAAAATQAESAYDSKQAAKHARLAYLSRVSPVYRQHILAESILSVVSSAQLLHKITSQLADNIASDASLELAKDAADYMAKQITDVFLDRLGVELFDKEEKTDERT